MRYTEYQSKELKREYRGRDHQEFFRVVDKETEKGGTCLAPKHLIIYTLKQDNRDRSVHYVTADTLEGHTNQLREKRNSQKVRLNSSFKGISPEFLGLVSELQEEYGENIGRFIAALEGEALLKGIKRRTFSF